MNTEIKIRQYDFFSFQEHGRTSHHCWDGQLVACTREDGSIYLADTYWASKYDKFQRGGDRKWFKIEDVEDKGSLKFICNLDDVEEIRKEEMAYYAEDDVFNLSYQHNCYGFFVKKKGAEKSQASMIELAKYKLQEAIGKKSSAEAAIVRLNDVLKKIEEGDTTVLIY